MNPFESLRALFSAAPSPAPRPSPETYGALAVASYRDGAAPPGYTDVTPRDGRLGADLRDAGAKMFQDARGNRVVSFAGTESYADAKTDLSQGLGVPPLKYRAAIRVGEALRTADVSFTGHSLGGGLAQIAGAVASENAPPKTVVAFNPAGVHAKTYAAAGIDPGAVKSEQLNVVHGTDLLQAVNEMQRMRGVGTTATLGERGPAAVERIYGAFDVHTADDPALDAAQKTMRTFGAGLNAHKMGSVMDEIRKLHPSDLAILTAARDTPVAERTRERGAHER